MSWGEKRREGGGDGDTQGRPARRRSRNAFFLLIAVLACKLLLSLTSTSMYLQQISLSLSLSHSASLDQMELQMAFFPSPAHPNQQRRTLNNLPTELILLLSTRLSITSITCKKKKCMRRARVPTELPFCTHAAVVGWVGLFTSGASPFYPERPFKEGLEMLSLSLSEYEAGEEEG